MIIPKTLRRNWQKISDNRFVVDSPRFWRREFHPRFKDIFEVDDFKLVVSTVNENLISYKLKPENVELLGTQLFNYFSGNRFREIPKKNPESLQQFIAELYMTLYDILPAISFKDYQLIEDDFNLVGHRAETDKNDTTKLATDEHNNENSLHESKLDILSEGINNHTDTANTENIDHEGWQNNKTIADVFLSPQNMGVTPTTENIDPTVPTTPLDKRGVNGIPNPSEAAFTTNTTKQNFGESNKTQDNTTAQQQQSMEQLKQNNDARTTHNTTTEMGMNQSQENATAKRDFYMESLDFNRGARLQDFHDLVDTRHWLEILKRLNQWILQADIATGERNYNECELYS